MLFRKLPEVSSSPIDLDADIVSAALRMLPKHQPLNQTTRTVHAAAWADLSGQIEIVREDVGRHNALDKLIGAMVMAKVQAQDGFVVMSSRCSYEIIEKANRLGVKAIATISAPTALALRKAAEAKMSIYVRDGNSVVKLG